MHSLRKRSSFALFGLLTYLLVGLGGVDGMVLCIEEDGHLAVEALHGSPCSSPFAPTLKNNHCSPCVDILISSHGADNIAVNTQRSFDAADAQVNLAEPFILSAFDKSISYELFPNSLAGKTSAMVSLRSVILLV